MLRRLVACSAAALVVGVGLAPRALAQPLGTFRWQLAPFCNVITAAVSQSAGGTFTLDGYDDQCGAATRAAVVGTAFPNPDGTIGIGLSIVATPGAAPVHVEVSISLATIGGPWRDSAGNAGTLAFNPPTPASGVRRPATGGLVSTITPGVGLSGGGSTGAVSLAVAFGGTGAATTVARSDHTHAVAGQANVGVGPAALSQVTSGYSNTAMGSQALPGVSTGKLNTAVGSFALSSATTADANVAIGALALPVSNGTGNVAIGSQALNGSGPANFNTAVGFSALFASETGYRNVAVGSMALAAATGTSNIGIGEASGANLRNGHYNLYIGSQGPVAAGDENGTIRIGGATQSTTYVAAVYNGVVNGASDQPVLVDASGRLGTFVSSARFKQDIRPLDGSGHAVLSLEPVSFRYRPDQQRGEQLQYGLIAEQVAEVMPDLVLRDDDGRPLTVKYHLLPTLLLAEIQRLERERAAQAEAIDAQALAIDALRSELLTLRHHR